MQSHTVGHAGSPACIVYADMTLAPSKVKLKVTGLLNFQKLWKIALFYVYSSAILVWGSQLIGDYDR